MAFPAESVGRVIRSARQRRGLSVRKLAQQLGIDPSYLSRIERGQKRPSVELVVRAAQVLEAPEILVSDIDPEKLQAAKVALEEYNRQAEPAEVSLPVDRYMDRLSSEEAKSLLPKISAKMHDLIRTNWYQVAIDVNMPECLTVPFPLRNEIAQAGLSFRENVSKQVDLETDLKSRVGSDPEVHSLVEALAFVAENAGFMMGKVFGIKKAVEVMTSVQEEGWVDFFTMFSWVPPEKIEALSYFVKLPTEELKELYSFALFRQQQKRQKEAVKEAKEGE